MEKGLSRQRLWQLEHARNGLCIMCGHKSERSQFCPKHWLANAVSQRDYARNRNGGGKYACLTTMIQVGLSLGRLDKETKALIRKKFGRRVDMEEFL